MEYLPPALAVEGTGVKRGLTAVEAAILLEAPLNKVMTMILFGLVKKGIVTVESEKPLKVSAADPAAREDAKLWYYERRFLQAVQPDGTLDEKELREMIIDLIGDVNKKLTGFSRKETKAYYQDIAARAWQQVEAADTPEVLGERWGDGLEWTMLDDDWDDRTRRVFQDRPVMLPHWWWFYRPWVGQRGRPSRPSGPASLIRRRRHPGHAAHAARRRLCQHGGQRRGERGQYSGQQRRRVHRRGDAKRPTRRPSPPVRAAEAAATVAPAPAPARVCLRLRWRREVAMTLLDRVQGMV